MNKQQDKNRKNKDGNREGGAKSFVKSLKSEKNRAVLARLAKLIARYRGLLILSIALAAISVVLQLYVPILFGDAIDELIAKNAVDFNRVVQSQGADLRKSQIIGVKNFTGILVVQKEQAKNQNDNGEQDNKADSEI